MAAVLDGVLSVFRSYQRELVCARCGSVVAWVQLRPFRQPEVRHISGPDVIPMGESLARAVAQTRLSTAQDTGRDPLFAGDPELDGAIERTRHELEYLNGQGGEPVYELLCTGCGSQHLRSMPHLSWMVRRAPTGRVPLR
ncbi:hypothetical protein [Pseudonocardia acaciae]|uniref:hypothetical protein n=1 Tax=Pseudonocardia acaciae TaxID=551276 RepID=UPI00048C8F27|nr:hypothetical protein [Pseudonocardia acaciae]